MTLCVCPEYSRVCSSQGGVGAGSGAALIGGAAGWEGPCAALLWHQSLQEGGGVCRAGPRTAQRPAGHCGRSEKHLPGWSLSLSVCSPLFLPLLFLTVCCYK